MSFPSSMFSSSLFTTSPISPPSSTETEKPETKTSVEPTPLLSGVSPVALESSAEKGKDEIVKETEVLKESTSPPPTTTTEGSKDQEVSKESPATTEPLTRTESTTTETGTETGTATGTGTTGTGTGTETTGTGTTTTTEEWACPQCTLLNPTSSYACQVCGFWKMSGSGQGDEQGTGPRMIGTLPLSMLRQLLSGRLRLGGVAPGGGGETGDDSTEPDGEGSDGAPSGMSGMSGFPIFRIISPAGSSGSYPTTVIDGREDQGDSDSSERSPRSFMRVASSGGGPWTCPSCTFVNGATTTDCDMCGNSR